MSDLVDAVEQTAAQLSRRRTGVVVAALRAGRTHVAGGGTAAGPAPGPRTLFEIGSITKVFTATLLADGIVRGDWELDTPVQELLPTDVTVPTRDGVAITLQHLATHTSGLPRSPVSLGLRENLAFLRHGTDPFRGLTEAEVLGTLRVTRMRRTPGTGRVSYSNFGFGLLGTALARASGQGFGGLVRRRIAEPLGLQDTSVEADMTASQRQRMANGHAGRRRRVEPWPLAGIPGAGALRSSADDLLAFLAAQLAPGSTPLAEAIRLTHRTPLAGPSSMGLGWHRADRGALWHNGGTGGFRTIIALRGQAAVAVLANQSAGVEGPAFRLLKQLS